MTAVTPWKQGPTVFVRIFGAYIKRLEAQVSEGGMRFRNACGLHSCPQGILRSWKVVGLGYSFQTIQVSRGRIAELVAPGSAEASLQAAISPQPSNRSCQLPHPTSRKDLRASPTLAASPESISGRPMARMMAKWTASRGCRQLLYTVCILPQNSRLHE